MRKRRATRRITPLRAAIEAGDLPVASLWLEHVDPASTLLERGVALLDALADPLLEDESARSSLVSRLADEIENGQAVGDADATSAQILLGAVLADPKAFDRGARARFIAIASMVEAPPIDARARQRLAKCREELIDRPTARKVDAEFRLDRGAGVIPEGRDVVVDSRTAVAIAELRAGAAELCRVLSESAVEPLLDVEADPSKLRMRCRESFLRELTQHVRTLHGLAAEAARELERGTAPRKKRAKRV